MRKGVVKNIWEIKKIKEIGRVVTGKTPPTRVKEYFGHEYPFITPTDIADNSRYVIMPARYLSKEGYEYQGSLALPKNTVCFTCIASIGKMAITNKVSFTNQQINSIIVDSNIADYRYIFYLLKTQVERIKNYAGGTANPIVSKSIFKEISIPCPTLPIQQKIALILSTYDDLIELNERRIKILEEMARLIYKEWFVKFRFPGYEKVKMKDSELGMIPKTWEVKDLDEVIDKITEKYTDENNELPLLNLARIPRKSLSISEFGKSDEITTSRILFKQNDILFSAIRTYFHKVILAPIDGITNVSVFVLRPKNDEYLELIFCKLFAKETINWATQNSTGTKMPVLSWNIFRKMKLIIHDIKTIKMFKSNVQPAFKKITILNKQNQVLRQTRDMLLPKLFSGEINVSDLDIKLEVNKYD